MCTVKRRAAFLFQQSQKLVHVLGPGAEIDGIDPKLGPAFQFSR